MTIYTTKESKGYGKNNYYWNEYRIEGNRVVKYRCNRVKHFDNKESNWVTSEKVKESWEKGDSNIPEWLHQYIS